MKRLPTFLAGMLTMALIGSVSVGALAATGQLTITVDPVKVQVNGQTFQPKDAKGNDVPVFAYNGTTYTPLRALAEAYGLEVGYDAEAKMATVGASAPAPDTTAAPADYSDWTAEEEAAYQEFKGMWDVTDRDFKPSNATAYFGLTCKDDSYGITFIKEHSVKERERFAARLYTELLSEELDEQYTIILLNFSVKSDVSLDWGCIL